MTAPPLMEAEHLALHFPLRGSLLPGREAGRVRAVDDVTLRLGRGETVGLVGESGCGKTTFARSLMRLLEPTAGAVRLEGRDVTHASARELRPLRRTMQMVFQDPLGSLNPRKRVGQIVAGPLRLHGAERRDARERAAHLLDQVGLGPELDDRYPHELSGGQRQRVGIARALALEPKLVVLDEPVSALDVSIQAQMVNLLRDLQDALGLSYLLVAHDLSVVRHASDRIAVMYLGKLVEVAPADELYGRPIHPYTAALLAAVPVPDPRARRRTAPVAGEPPSAVDPPSGCVFHPRCPRATEICTAEEPALMRYPGGHLAACHHPLGVGAADVNAAERAPESPLSAGETTPAA